MQRIPFISICLVVLLSACTPSNNKKLPILGQHEYINRTEGLKVFTDTIFYSVPKFEFSNQNGDQIKKSDLNGKIIIADFFFTSCPTICPVMSRNMLEVTEEFKDHKDVMMLSFSIDPIHDSIPVLKKYADKLQAPSKWHFLTGDKNQIFNVAKGFMVSAAEDANAPGGLVHSGAFIILDGKQRIRAYYDGTKTEDIPKVISDVKILLDEK